MEAVDWKKKHLDSLREMAACLETRRRETDVLARYGGEEFVMLLVGTPLDAGLAVAEDLRTRTACSNARTGRSIGRNARAAIAASPIDGSAALDVRRAQLVPVRSAHTPGERP
jgi:diguanylate cyclase (GGDEF)-like protein